ncbi:MAG: hypothetical protein FJY88_04855 [Candidatus Eisenbacteria bacterium]|nr:hypothetical protein [Candidatus Eisenbacteria bacterium]
MTTGEPAVRYEMVNVQMGYVMVEHDLFSRAVRSYFSTEPPLPREEYREGNKTWRSAAMGQSFRFDVRDTATGEVVKFREMLGLLYYALCKPESEIYRIGRIAHDNGISIYMAITHDTGEGTRLSLSDEKLGILNAVFNQRLRRPGKKVLILPDLFDLHKTMSYGEIMIDFGLTSMGDE